MSGLKNTLEAATLVDILNYRAVNQPHQTVYTFLIDGETKAVELTYSQLEQRAKAIAAYLQSVSFPQERVLLLYPPGLEYIEAFFGCLYAGVIAIPAYTPRPNRSLARLQSIIRDAEATIALTTHSVYGSLERQLERTPELKSLRWLTTDNLASDDVASSWRSPKLSSSTLAFLQYTSGSTAEPKGVKIAYQNLLHNLEAIHRCFRHSEASRGVIWLPPYHDMGLIGGILQPLYGNFPVTLMSPLMFLQNPMRWLKAISRHRATTSGGPNFAYDLCVRKFKPELALELDLSSWEVAFNGAEPINYETLEKFAATFAPYGFRMDAFYPCYGMAEATLIISGGSKNAAVVTKTVQGKALEQNQILESSEAENSRILVSCGNSLPDQKVVIVNPETHTTCPSGEVGEIWVSGASVAGGYWQQNLETERTFNARLQDTNEKGFLRTGDLGFFEDGEIFVTGRLKDMIIIKGRNHYPQDIEKTVQDSNSIIRPSCVASFSVNVEGEEKLIVLAEVERQYWSSNRSSKSNGNGHKNGIPNTKELIQLIRRQVSKNHDLQIHTTLLLKPGGIPKTSSGKIQRHVCRAGFLAGTFGEMPF